MKDFMWTGLRGTPTQLTMNMWLALTFKIVFCVRGIGSWVYGVNRGFVFPTLHAFASRRGPGGEEDYEFHVFAQEIWGKIAVSQTGPFPFLPIKSCWMGVNDKNLCAVMGMLRSSIPPHTKYFHTLKVGSIGVSPSPTHMYVSTYYPLILFTRMETIHFVLPLLHRLTLQS